MLLNTETVPHLLEKAIEISGHEGAAALARQLDMPSSWFYKHLRGGYQRLELDKLEAVFDYCGVTDLQLLEWAAEASGDAKLYVLFRKICKEYNGRLIKILGTTDDQEADAA